MLGSGATEHHGQDIFWGAGSAGAVQGMTELTECKRLEDPDTWFLGVQDEFRRGALTEDTHAFLHGLPTSVPGSWLGGQVACGNQRCKDLLKTMRQSKRTRRGEGKVDENYVKDVDEAQP